MAGNNGYHYRGTVRGTEAIEGTQMDAKAQVLEVKKSGEIVSPKRCFWQPS